MHRSPSLQLFPLPGAEKFKYLNDMSCLTLRLSRHVSHVAVQEASTYSHGLPAVTPTHQSHHTQSLFLISPLSLMAGGAPSHLSLPGCLCRADARLSNGPGVGDLWQLLITDRKPTHLTARHVLSSSQWYVSSARLLRCA